MGYVHYCRYKIPANTNLFCSEEFYNTSNKSEKAVKDSFLFGISFSLSERYPRSDLTNGAWR